MHCCSNFQQLDHLFWHLVNIVTNCICVYSEVETDDRARTGEFIKQHTGCWWKL